MNYLIKLAATATAAATASALGGCAPIVVEPTEVVAATEDTLTFIDDEDVVARIQLGGSHFTFAPVDLVYSGNGFSHYRYAFLSDNSLISATTESGGGEVQAFALEFFTTDLHGARLTRIGETELPVGQVDFTGHSLEMFVSSGYDLQRIISGDVALAIDFDAGTFSGDITGRANADTLVAEGLDVEFAGTILDGELTGVADQGANNGAMHGLVVGPDGSEVIGTYTFNDYDSLFGSIVRGAFWAEQ